MVGKGLIDGKDQGRMGVLIRDELGPSRLTLPVSIIRESIAPAGGERIANNSPRESLSLQKSTKNRRGQPRLGISASGWYT